MGIDIKDYGFNAGTKISDIFAKAIEEAKIYNKELRVAAAINNNDYEGMLISIIKDDTASVIKGMSLAAKEYGAKAGIVYLREEDAELTSKIQELGKTEGLDIAIEVIDIVDLHVKNTDQYVNALCHFETYTALVSGKKTVLLTSKVDGKLGELKEYPFGVKVSEVLKDVDVNEIKMIYIGTKCYDKSALEMEITEDFQPSNGVIKVLNNTICAVEQTVAQLAEHRIHSCGTCMFCREGGIQMHTVMKDFTAGKGKVEDFALLTDLTYAMPFSNVCSVGKSGGDSVDGLFKYFADELDDHVKRKKCPVDVCQAFMNIYIDPMKCTGCEDCVDVCPVDCIEGDDGYIHMIDDMDCIKCGKCIEVCSDNAIVRATGRLPKLPDKLTKVGKFRRS